MGRAIDMEKDIDALKGKVERLETAFEGLASTVETLENTAPAKKHVDLHKKSDTKKDKKELVEEAEV